MNLGRGNDSRKGRLIVEPSALVHEHESRGGAVVAGGGRHRAEADAAHDEACSEQVRLGLLAGAVAALDDQSPDDVNAYAAVIYAVNCCTLC